MPYRKPSEPYGVQPPRPWAAVPWNILQDSREARSGAVRVPHHRPTWSQYMRAYGSDATDTWEGRWAWDPPYTYILDPRTRAHLGYLRADLLRKGMDPAIWPEPVAVTRDPASVAAVSAAAAAATASNAPPLPRQAAAGRAALHSAASLPVHV